LAGDILLLCSATFFTTNASNTLFLKPEQQEQLGKTKLGSGDSNKFNFKDTGCEMWTVFYWFKTGSINGAFMKMMIKTWDP
jgi:hypothetical protein